ncbi:MAG TPA: tripartite tricarboxylate transporter substrate binding protein [Xanthobacteraceae bacterium]|nr:tripartite tricarboxylate transporter substrate binding protein [Xanthobacteraceae bacterium]
MMTRALAMAILGLVLGAAAAQAQSFPNRAVRIIVPYPAGGSVDNISRAVAPRLSAIWGQPIVIENRAGGATAIAADMVAKSTPDGYTLFATGMETFAINPYMLSKLSYDVKDFTSVSGYGLSNQILVVPSASPFKSIAELMAHARAKPGELNYATIGLGGSSHINMVLFESMTGLKLTPVHYKGGAPAVTDLLGGHVPSAFLSSQLVDQGIKSGHIRALAVASKARLRQHPDVPTVAESGVPGFEAVSWFGVWAPAGTPRDVVLKINADLQKVFADADFREKFLDRAMLEANTGSPEQFAEFIKAEAAKWSKVVKDANLKVD